MMNGVKRQRVHVNRLKPCYRQLGRRDAVDDQGPQMGEPKLGLHYSKKSREAPIVRQVGDAVSRSSLLLVHLVSTGI